MRHRLAHRLARDGAGVDAGAADDVLAFDEGDLFTRFGGVNRRPLAGGAGANDDQVEGRHAEANCPLTLPALSTLIQGIRTMGHALCQV